MKHPVSVSTKPAEGQSTEPAEGQVDNLTYALRDRIERFFRKIKHSRRVATGYDKLAFSFLSFAQFAKTRC